MATNMPTHNLGEVYKAIELVMTKRRPKPTVDELMEVLPGPDFPSGGIVLKDTLRDAYESGRGSVRVRAKAETIKVTKTRQALVITELPYMVGPEKVITKINELAAAGKLPGVDEREGAKNLSDKTSGLRLQIDLRPGASPKAVLANLYRLTPLEETFAINNVVLVDGVPTTVGLWDLCHHWIQHRLEVVVRRTEFWLRKWEERLHIVAGLLIALDNIDRVIEIIRASADTPEARSSLMSELDLSEVQATHVLDMPLKRLTSLEVQKLEDEAEEPEGESAVASFEIERVALRDTNLTLVDRTSRPPVTWELVDLDADIASIGGTKPLEVSASAQRLRGGDLSLDGEFRVTTQLAPPLGTLEGPFEIA